MTVDMIIEQTEGIVNLGITTKEFPDEYCILLGKSMYVNVDAALLWLRLLYKYLTKEFYTTRIQAEYCIFYTQYDSSELGLVISVHVEDVFMVGSKETLEI